ncbi:MAG: hypothetical protein IJD20_01685, partial [Oscillospiraceae bacterium]|nr:hypothetical protein [Oscillospiraceae bacterium]
ASYTETGFAAHYYCSDCGTYWDAEENETTREALVLSVVPCPHAAAENVPAVPATFLEGGKIEHWSCGDCNKLFSDEDLTVEITETDIATEKRPTTDTEGLSDDELAELGAVAITIDPEGVKVAYTGTTAINAAYKAAAQWTDAGGVVKMVTDYTYCDTAKNPTGYITSGADTKATNNSYLYPNADSENEKYAGLDLKGFWLDLNGHTLVFRTGRALFSARYSLPVNVKNGTIIYQNTAAAGNYGIFKNGTTDQRLNSDTEIYRPEYTLDNVTIIEVFRMAGTDARYTPIFHVGAQQSQINLIDSTILNNNEDSVFAYVKTDPDPDENPEVDAFASSKGYQHIVNLRGNTLVGSFESEVIRSSAAGNGNSGAEADYIRVNAEDSVKFLGTSFARFSKDSLKLRSFLPTHYTAAAEKYGCTLPKVESLGTETTIGGVNVENEETPTEATQWVPVDTANAAAKVTVSGDDYTMYVLTAGEAVQRAEYLASVGYEATATLLADTAVVETAAIGGANATSEFTLDLNGKALTGAALVEANGGTGTNVTINVTGTLGNQDGKLKFFAHAPAVEYTGAHSFVVSKGAYFDSYSLNLENTISVNLYTKNDPDAVCYVQDGEDQTPVKNADNDWTVTSLAAKDMGKTIDAYAIKTEGTTTTIDFSKDISVKGYVTNKAAEGDNTDALKDALAAMLIYGKYADKYFANEYEAIDDALAYVNETGLELTEVPVDYEISNITEGRVVEPAELDISSATTGVWGYRGTSAVLADEISMKLYFYGAEFNPEHVTINGAAATEEQVDYVDNFTTVKVSVNAKEFDTAIEIALDDGDGHAVTVTDSVAAYAKRLLEDESNSTVHNVAQAMLNYCYYTQQHFNSNP